MRAQDSDSRLKVLLVEDNPNDIARFSRVAEAMSERVFLVVVEDGSSCLGFLR